CRASATAYDHRKKFGSVTLEYAPCVFGITQTQTRMQSVRLLSRRLRSLPPVLQGIVVRVIQRVAVLHVGAGKCRDGITQVASTASGHRLHLGSKSVKTSSNGIIGPALGLFTEGSVHHLTTDFRFRLAVHHKLITQHGA